MNAEILCVGTELLLGDIVNTNAAYIARGLARIGVNVYHQSVVGDNPERLRAVLALALERSDCVIMTGGLGPTYDDLTKETAAALFGMELEMHEPSLARITAYFERSSRPMTENNKKQAMMPKGAVILPNENGTAPGMVLEKGGKTAVLLPGPPREMEPMFEGQVLPYLQKKTNAALVSHTVHLFGIGESAAEDILRETMVNAENPTIAPYAKEGEVLLRVTARGANEREADALTWPMIEKIRCVFGEKVYGVDIGNLQTALVRALREKGLCVASAESCTGGYISKRITEVPGSSEVFGCGVCSYANEVKESVLGVSRETLARCGAVSEQVAAQMAQGVRRISGAQIGISTTGIAGPGGGTAEKPIGLVYVGVSSERFSSVKRLLLGRGYGDEREYIRYVAASHALHLALQAAARL